MMNRRDFFRVVAASGATAAASGCQRATETILPLVVPNEQIVPGVAAWFATVCRECPAGCGVIAKNREGRVVKLEGNPDHPVNQGALCARGQAALQGLYHPDRFAGPRLRDGATLKPAPWDAAQKVVADKLADLRSAAKGQAIALVTQLETSSLGALLDKWTQALGTRPRVTFEPFAYEALRAANRITFGRDAIPYFAFEDAEVVLSFGADFLETWLSNVNYARTFARMHTVRDGRAGTFIHVEPRQSLTASNADEWVRNAPGTEGQLALAMLKVMVDERLADRRFAEAVAAIDVKKIAADSGVPVETIVHVAEVFAHGRPGLAVGGGMAVTGSNATSTRVAGRLLAPRGRQRAHAAHDVARARLTADGRHVPCDRPRRAPERGGKGAAALGDLRAVPQSDVGAPRPGRVGSDAPPGRRLEGAGAGRRQYARGSGGRDASQARRRGGRARAPRLPVAPVLRRAGRQSCLAPGSAGHDDPGRLGPVGGDRGGDGGEARHRRRRRGQADVAARLDRIARVRLADAPSTGGRRSRRPSLRALSRPALCAGALRPEEPGRDARGGRRERVG